MKDLKHLIATLITKALGSESSEMSSSIEVPPKPDMGDFSFPCFSLAKTMKKSPLDIAEELTEKLRKNLPKEITNVEMKAGYVNFFVNKKILAMTVLDVVKKKGFGILVKDAKRIGIEYPSPNTNKALHVGHLRNMAIGTAISGIVKAAGNSVVHSNLYNDRGILISKSMLGYEKYALGKTPTSEGVKGDRFVGDLYVRFSKASAKDKKLEEEAQEKLKLWEKGDLKTRALWKKLNDWSYEGIQETFTLFGLPKIDKHYYESELYTHGKEIVEKGLKKKIFKKAKDGAIVVDLEKEKLGEKVLLRRDGTSLYITQDLYLADKRIKDFKLDSSYYVVGDDQNYHFKVLFTLLEKLGVKKDLKHLSYGMVALPEGKMKSREGTSVSADELIAKTKELAKKGLIKRGAKPSDKEIDERALIIALAAIKYNLLKVDIKKRLIFNPKEALAFEGDTGPYLLYSYARANSIIRKVKSNKPVKIIDLKDKEIMLLKKIGSFEEMLTAAYGNLAPHLLANYAYELSQLFNEFYHDCPVMGSDAEGFRLKLVDVFRITLGKALDLLGIEKLGEM